MLLTFYPKAQKVCQKKMFWNTLKMIKYFFFKQKEPCLYSAHQH